MTLALACALVPPASSVATSMDIFLDAEGDVVIDTVAPTSGEVGTAMTAALWLSNCPVTDQNSLVVEFGHYGSVHILA